MNIYRKRKARIQDLVVGDVALTKDDESAPRTQWRIGRILEHVKDLDGLTRGAKLRVLAKGGAHSSIYRPLQKLIPFEIVENDVNMDEESNEDTDTKKNSTNETELRADEKTGKKRLMRKAAIERQHLRRIREQYL